ncbi:hypothetical protein Rruber_05117 (plasmid) [Rhodococcus ruber]
MRRQGGVVRRIVTAAAAGAEWTGRRRTRVTAGGPGFDDFTSIGSAAATSSRSPAGASAIWSRSIRASSGWVLPRGPVGPAHLHDPFRLPAATRPGFRVWLRGGTERGGDGGRIRSLAVLPDHSDQRVLSAGRVCLTASVPERALTDTRSPRVGLTAGAAGAEAGCGDAKSAPGVLLGIMPLVRWSVVDSVPARRIGEPAHIFSLTFRSEGLNLGSIARIRGTPFTGYRPYPIWGSSGHKQQRLQQPLCRHPS